MRFVPRTNHASLTTVKNWPNQIAACRIAAQRGVPIHVTLGNNDPGLIGMLGDLPHKIMTRKPWHEYIEYIATKTDLGLQCSFSESFNFVALEHMLCGVPVVASPAIRFAEITCNPDSPEEIAERIEACWRQLVVPSRAVHQLAARNNDRYLGVLRGLLSTGGAEVRR